MRYTTAMRRALLLTATLLAACGGDTFVARDTRATFDPASTDFWALPMPSDLRRQANGTFNLERYPGKRSALLDMWIKSADSRLLDGWGVTTGIFFTTSAALDPASFPTNAATLEPTASVYLVDIEPNSPDYGKHLPVDVSFTAAEGAGGSPANLLEVIPVYGFVRRPLTTYAVVVTDALKDTAGKPLGRALAFHQALENTAGADAKAAASFEPLRAFLTKEKRDRTKVVAATVFKTMDPSATLVKLADWVEKQPQPLVDAPWKLEDDFVSYQWVSGVYTVPQVQEGDRPGLGRIQWDTNGEPKKMGSQQLKLALTIPKTPMPPGGFPLMIYFHGSGGEWRESLDRGPRPQIKEYRNMDPPLGSGPAEYLARRGIAALGFDFPLHGNRQTPPDTSGLQLYNLFGNIDVTLDNMQVGAMEVVYLTRLVSKMEVPVALSPTHFNPGAATDGLIRFNVDRLTAMGHSMGSTFGIPIASVDPRIKGYVFSGAGGSLVEIAMSAHEPTNLKPFIELLLDFPQGQELRRSHPLLHLFQNLWDFADPAAKARYVAREPRPGHVARPFFMTAGVRDGYFHPNAETATAVALGATAVGTDVDPIIPAALALAGKTTVAFPLSNNLNGVTGGVVQYAAPFELGHYVAFDQADTRQQFTCFLLGVGTPAGPKISAASGSDTMCP